MFRRAGLVTTFIAMLVAVMGPTALAGGAVPTANITPVDTQVDGAGVCTLSTTYSWTGYTAAHYVDVVMTWNNGSYYADVVTTVRPYTKAHRSGSVTLTAPATGSGNQVYWVHAVLMDRNKTAISGTYREDYTSNVPCTPTGF